MSLQSKINIWESIQPDFNHMQTSSTVGGAITDFGFLFRKLQTLLSEMIIQIENRIAEEDETVFKKFEEAVDSLQSKIRSLLHLTSWENDSWQMRHIDNLLAFNVISLGSRGYLSDMLSELRRIGLEVFQNQLGQPSEFCILDFNLPTFVIHEINKLPLQDQIYEWKEKADTPLLNLYRFLKMLSLYDSSSHLTLSTASSPWISPKNLQELQNREYHIRVGYYLNLFKSSDIKEHPFNVDELYRLIKRFISFLEKEIRENDSPSSIDPPASKGYFRTQQCDADVKVLISLAKDKWKQALSTCKHPREIGAEKMAQELLKGLPANISLYAKGEKQLPRALKAIKATDPRIFENGKFIDLKPHWVNFDWVKI